MSGCNIPNTNPRSWSPSILPGIHSSIKNTQTKGVKRRCPELLQSYPHLRSAVGLSHRTRLPGRDLQRKGLPAKGFCSQLDPPYLLRSGLSQRSPPGCEICPVGRRPVPLLLALLPAWGAMVWSLATALLHAIPEFGAGRVLRASGSASFREKWTREHSGTCPGIRAAEKMWT